MTIASRLPIHNTNISRLAIAEANTAPATYERIVVLLDGSPAAEQAIAIAIELGQSADAEITLICNNQCGATDYIHAKVNALKQQRINARGYVFSGEVNELPAWVRKSEKANVILVAQKSVGWLGRLFGQDLAMNMSSCTNADVFQVAV